MSDYYRDHKFAPLPVYGGLCQAKHIYTKEHAEGVIRVSSLDTLDARYAARVPIFSTNTGKPFPGRSASELFFNIIEEILTQSIKWDNVISGIVQRAKAAVVSECIVLIFRNSLPVRDLVRDLVAALELESAQFKTRTKDMVPWIANPGTLPRGPRSNQQAKIAIVGMSCRMPDGATDTERFWEILDQGLDVHRKIPPGRDDIETHHDPTGKRVNTSITPYGCFINEPGLFDAPF